MASPYPDYSRCTKAELRTLAKGIAHQIGPERRSKARHRLERLYKQLPAVGGIASFISMADEPDTSGLNALIGDRLWLPDRSLALQPGPAAPALQLVLVPGLLMSPEGQRLGRGAGWYDRVLAAQPELEAWGICWQELGASALPTSAHDAPLQRVIYV